MVRQIDNDGVFPAEPVDDGRDNIVIVEKGVGILCQFCPLLLGKLCLLPMDILCRKLREQVREPHVVQAMPSHEMKHIEVLLPRLCQGSIQKRQQLLVQPSMVLPRLPKTRIGLFRAAIRVELGHIPPDAGTLLIGQPKGLVSGRTQHIHEIVVLVPFLIRLGIMKGEQFLQHSHRCALRADGIAEHRQFPVSLHLIQMRRVFQIIAIKMHAPTIGGFPKDENHIGDIPLIGREFHGLFHFFVQSFICLDIIQRSVHGPLDLHRRNVQRIVQHKGMIVVPEHPCRKDPCQEGNRQQTILPPPPHHGKPQSGESAIPKPKGSRPEQDQQGALPSHVPSKEFPCLRGIRLQYCRNDASPHQGLIIADGKEFQTTQ